ncbi:MAG: hypothetical protein MZU97_06045 [Bacillus subtilis]|nr:hypothetical protein [Bacillus subtilis]
MSIAIIVGGIAFGFRRFFKLHPKLQSLTIVLLSQVLFSFRRRFYLEASAASRDNLLSSKGQVIQTLRREEGLYSISTIDYVRLSNSQAFRETSITVYKPALIGYRVSKADSQRMIFVYDDLSGEREIITFFIYTMADGSRFIIIGT